MGKLIITAVSGGSEEHEGTYEVEDLAAATEALKKDLLNTADLLWGAQVMDRWNKHPGYCEMPDQEVTWYFRYEEDK